MKYTFRYNEMLISLVSYCGNVIGLRYPVSGIPKEHCYIAWPCCKPSTFVN